MSYIYNLTDTWNAAGTTFNAIKMNVTDTASAAGSLLMDLQVGGSSQFNVAKTGLVTLNPALTTGGVLSAGTNAFKTIQFGSSVFGSNGMAAIRDGEGVVVRGGTGFSWEDGGNNPASGVVDLRIVRDAANILAQRSGTAAQTFRVYNTYTDASNYERASIGWSASTFRIATEALGTGSPRQITLATSSSVAPIQFITNNTDRWNIAGAGHFLANTDNAYDIGASGANRPRAIYMAGLADIRGSLYVGGAVEFIGVSAGVVTLREFATSAFNRLQFGGTSSAFPALKRNGTAINVRLADDSADAPFTSGRATIDGLTVGKGGQTAVSANTALGVSTLSSASLTGNNNTAVGSLALQSVTTGGENTAIGAAAHNSNISGSSNTAVGYQSLYSSTTAANNTAVGLNTLVFFNTSNNTALGYEAIRGSTTVANNTGSNLTAVGYRALSSNTSGTENVAVGLQALNQTTTGAANTAVGTYSLYSNTTGGNNTAVGVQALVYFNTSNNTALGYDALRGSTTVANNTGDLNVGVGFYALRLTTSGNRNTAVGSYAGQAVTTGIYNTAHGYSALGGATTGGYNTAVGYSAANTTTTGANNVVVGALSNASAAGGADQIVIGHSLTGKGDETAFIGGTNGAYNEKNVTTWETTSDARIKKDIADFSGGLDVIEQVRVRTFKYRAPDEITDLPQSAAIQQPGVQLGVIAQELQAVLPGCVTENSTGVLSVSTDPLVWYLINAVKELAAEVKALKGE